MVQFFSKKIKDYTPGIHSGIKKKFSIQKMEVAVRKVLNKILVLSSFLIFSSFQSYAAPFFSAIVESQLNESNGSSTTVADDSDLQWLAGKTANASLTNATYEELRNFSQVANPVKTTVTYSGQAKSSYDGLQSKVSGDQFSEEFTGEITGEIKSELAQFNISSTSYFSDSLTVTGADDLSYIKFSVNIHGTRSNAPFGAYIGVDTGGNIFSTSDESWNGTNDFAITVDSNNFNIKNNKMFLQMLLRTDLDFYLGGEGIDNEYTGIYREIDFYNTVTIGQLRGYNDSGESVDLSSAIGSDGMIYDTLRVEPSPVPVPGAALLLGSGLLGLAGLRRKKKAAVA